MLSMLFLFFSLISFTDTEWTWSVHPESNFKVLTPFPLNHNTIEIPTGADPILYHQYQGGSIEDSDLRLAFVVDHYSISDQEIGSDPEFLREFFESTIDQIIHALGGTLIYKDITAHSGRDVCIWKATYMEGKGIIKGNLIIEKNKYYGLQAFSLNNDASDKLMQKFFDSFQVLPTGKP